MTHPSSTAPAGPRPRPARLPTACRRGSAAERLARAPRPLRPPGRDAVRRAGHGRRRRAGHRVVLPALATWSPRPAAPRPPRPPGRPGAASAPSPPPGPADLAIAGSCEHGCPAAPGGPDGALFAACERLLRPGGILAVITAGPDPGHTGAAAAAARAAGLLYTQHIVLLHAAVDGDRLDPGPTAHEGAPEGAVVHSDLLVFTKPGSRP